MLYLSRLILNPRSRQVQAELRAPYEMHRTLAKAFGEGEEAQTAARCLFRVEESPQGALTVLVQSRTEPLWERMTTPTDYLQEPPQTKPFTPRFRAGQPFAFRLRANPTKRLPHPDANEPAAGRRTGNRVGLYTDEERLTWLSRKASESGFTLCSVTQTSEVSPDCQAKGRRAVFSAARFEGVLRVTDPTLLSESLSKGIGAGKGFGFGLLSLAPIK